MVGFRRRQRQHARGDGGPEQVAAVLGEVREQEQSEASGRSCRSFLAASAPWQLAYTMRAAARARALDERARAARSSSSTRPGA